MYIIGESCQSIMTIYCIKVYENGHDVIDSTDVDAVIVTSGALQKAIEN